MESFKKRLVGHTNPKAPGAFSVYSKSRQCTVAQSETAGGYNTHTPSVWGQGSLGRRAVVHTLRQPVVGSKLFVICHHIPLLAPVSGFSNLFHLTSGAIYTLLLLTSRKGKQACQDRRERKTAVRSSHNAWETKLQCCGKPLPLQPPPSLTPAKAARFSHPEDSAKK